MTSSNGTPERPLRRALSRLRRQTLPRGCLGMVALAVAFGLGRASKGPDPRPLPGAEEAPSALPASRPRPLAAPLREAVRREPPAVFLERPAFGPPEPGAHEVLCIIKPGRSARQSIRQLGGRRRDGAPWRVDRERATEGVKAGVWSFRVGNGDAAADVIVDVSRSGNEILKTRPDGREDNNLLSLPECP